MPKKTLRVIAKPDDSTRVVITDASRKLRTLVVGKGAYDLLCGGCGEKLAKSLRAGQMAGAVFHCSVCGAYNDTTDAPN